VAVNKRDLDAAWRVVMETIDGEHDDYQRFLLIESLRPMMVRDLDLAAGRAAFYADCSIKTLHRASHIGYHLIRLRIERWARTAGISERAERPYQEAVRQVHTDRMRAAAASRRT
jgi:hypothetical protein